MRAEITETVLYSDGTAVLGANVQVNLRGGAAATVYAAESGAGTAANPLTTDENGRIEGWLDEGSYDLVVTAPSVGSYTQRFEAIKGSNTVALAPDVTGRNWIQPAGPGIRALLLKGAAGQSVNLLELRKSDDTVYGFVVSVGSLQMNTKSAFGDSVNSARLTNPTGQRALSLIDTGGTIRVWRYVAQNSASNPALEFIQGTAADTPGDVGNRWMDLYMDSVGLGGLPRLVLRDRTQGNNVDLLAAIKPAADDDCGVYVSRQQGGVITMQRVTQGAAGSGGVGFKVLRVPN